MLTCQQLTELVTDYLERRMSFLDRIRVQMHLGMCRRCRVYLRQMKITMRTLGYLPTEAIPNEVREELLARFRNMRPRSTTPPVFGSKAVRLFAALEKAFGGWRGFGAMGLVVGTVVFLLFLSGVHFGPLGNGSRCLVTEVGAGLLLLAIVGVLAASTCRVSAGVYVAMASLGALGGHLALLFSCEWIRIAPHVLVFHLGGVLLAAGMGALASRIPRLRR